MSTTTSNPESDKELASVARAEAKSFVEDILNNAPKGSFSARAVLDANPLLEQYPSCVIDLAYEEYCRARENGMPIAASQFVEAFSGVEQSLYRVIEFDQVLHEHPSLVEDIPESRWPERGTVFCGFELVEQIGRGAMSRVFIARQIDLGQRQVVVKICIRGEREADLLGMLEYQGIAQVYSIHLDQSTGLAAICMPFQTRVTMHHLAEWVTTLPSDRVGRRLKARELREFIHQYNDADHVPAPESDDNDEDSQNLSSEFSCHDDDGFPTALLKWGIQLAKSLDHAHRMQVLHCDVKPGNVLMLPDLSANLLDFNLASSEKDALRLAGGTLPYMASEQLKLMLSSESTEATEESQTDSAEECNLSASTDVFGLCATLWHTATGAPPFGATVDVTTRTEAAQILLKRQSEGITKEGMVRVREILPNRVVDILLQGLSFDPADRPPSADVLAGQLRGQLTRRRRMTRRGLMGLIAAVAIVAGGLMWRNAAAGIAAHSAVVDAQESFARGDVGAARLAVLPFRSVDAKCQFLELLFRTCQLPAMVIELEETKGNAGKNESTLVEWNGVRADWKTLAARSPYAAEAWLNCAFVSMELADFESAEMEYSNALKNGIDEGRSRRAKLIFDLSKRQNAGRFPNFEALQSLKSNAYQPGSRGEFIAYVSALGNEVRNSPKSAILDEHLTDLLATLDGSREPIVETEMARLVLKKCVTVARNPEQRTQILRVARAKSPRSFNRLRHVLVAPGDKITRISKN